jgi:hypothetical protein
MDARLEEKLNLLLESERAGVLALEELGRQVEHAELRRFLAGSRENEATNVRDLEKLIGDHGGKPSEKIGPFAGKVAALSGLREKLALLSRGQEWAARKTEEALAVAPATGPIHDYLSAMANRHRAEVEWGRAEVIRLLPPEN